MCSPSPGRTEVPRTLPLAPRPGAGSRHEGSGDSLAPCRRFAAALARQACQARHCRVTCPAWARPGTAGAALGTKGVWRSRAGQPSTYAEKLEAWKQRATTGVCHPHPAPPLPPGVQVLGQTAGQVGVSRTASAGLGKANTAGHCSARLLTYKTAAARGGLVCGHWGPSGRMTWPSPPTRPSPPTQRSVR